MVPVTDVREAQAQYDLAFAQTIAAENNLASAHEALFLITGDANIKLNTLAADLPLNPPNPIEIEDWVKLALENNPELMVARMASKPQNLALMLNAGHVTQPLISLFSIAQRNNQQGRPDPECR